ncbi:MAG: MBL fold metallo-hydrolase [Candidatus Bathyarchaeota archaeon]|nr:MAG: MBL fold metallo-hydrolase [Candidatus Bathyarchaeota archaeon]
MRPMSIHFLGTGGGRFSMITQRRRTAGIRLVHGDTHVHIDPGPGTLVFSNWARLSPQKLDGLIVTHCHPDHYTDAEVLIEAMSHGTTRSRGVLAAPRSVLHGNDECDPSVSTYHRNLPAVVENLEPGSVFEVGALSFEAVEARHSEADGIGIRLKVPGLGEVGYTSDTGFFEGLEEIYRRVRLLIACTMWPRAQHLKYHLNTDETLELIELAKPGCVVLTHFGMRMLNASPEAEASYLEEATGVPTVAARDGTLVVLGEWIEVRGPRKRDEPRLIEA